MKFKGLIIILIAILIFMIYEDLNNKPSYPDYTEVCRDKSENCTTEILDIFDPSLIKVKFIIDDLVFIIPRKFISPPSWPPVIKPSRYGDTIIIKWPSMNHIDDDDWKTGSDKNTIRISFNLDSRTPKPVTVEKLENYIISNHDQPVILEEIEGLQEYPSNGYMPHYRSIDNSIRFADGLPSYIYCYGKPVTKIKNYDFDKEINNGHSCIMEMTWPNSLIIKINFNKSLLSKWKNIHDKSIELLKSFEINNRLPKGTLVIN